MAVLPDQLRWLAEQHPDAVAYEVAGVGALTATAWHRDSSRLARGLVARGIRPGARVALLLPQAAGLRFVVAYAAIHKAGGVAVPVNVRLSPPEVARLLEHCGARLVVVSPGLRHLAGDELPVLDTETDWEASLHPDGSDLQVPRGSDDLAELLYTSGTTGAPKGVEIEHGNAALRMLARPTWTGAAWLHASPLSTFAGLTFVYQPMRMGMRTLQMPAFDVGDWLDLVERQRPPAAFLVPAMVELLLASGQLAGRDLSSLAVVSVGSAPAAPATLLRLQDALPEAAITNSYSMTEAGTTYCMLPKGELRKRPGSVGKPLPPAEIRIVDEQSEEVPRGVTGEIVIKPAGRPRRYHRDPEATAALYRGQWLRTGDLGHLDDDGYLFVTGRAKDVIIRGGNNVHASDVEAVLYEHPAVREAAVAAIPHAVLGEDVAAYVVLTDGAATTPEELIAFARGRLADYKVPRLVELRRELPRNATGKVQKRDLHPRAP